MIAGEAKEALRGELLKLGFDVARFSNLEPLGENRLKAWVEAGYHADMHWLKQSVEKRLDPRLVLPDVCSVIMLGVNYLPSDEGAREQRGFAKYSLYRDYHDTVLEGLKAVASLLEGKYGLGPGEYRYYVDTGPVMERGWAAASGMGWQGKNGMLISREHGNWLLLASVLLKLEIEPDGPLKKSLANGDEAGKAELGLLCGKCTRCVDACPTGAIVELGILDTRLCISYHTIENKGWIPRELRSRFGGRVYGCDICLDACPWNRFAQAGRLQLLESRYEVGQLGLLDLLRMDAATFRETFRKMPVKRTKLRGLKRNACVAAGNLRDGPDWWPEGSRAADGALTESGEAWLVEIVDTLVGLAEGDEEALARGHAVWALRRLLGDQTAAARLGAAREKERDAEVLAEYGAGD